MSDARVLAAVMVAVEHFLGRRQSAETEVRAALELIGAAGQFEVLGHAVYCAMLRSHIMQMRARRAALVDQLAGSPKPPLH